MTAPLDANAVVEEQLDQLLGNIAHAFGGDALSWYGPITYGADTAVRRVIEERRKTDRSDDLAILLTTPGGVVEIVQRIVAVVRHYFQVVNFIIPDYAYSAGTVLVMSGDAIHMDYYSRLGPIDPQILRGDRLVPALGYCERYNELIKESGRRALTDAELAVLIGAFDQAELYQYEQARELSISLLKDWLVRYKFKDWSKTETRQRDVTSAMKKQRARAIARALSNTARWHSHAAGISAEVLRDQLKLRIDDLDEQRKQVVERKQAVENYQSLLEDYMIRRQHFGVIHMRGQYVPYHVHE